MALSAVPAYLGSIGLSDPDLLMSIAETVDGWETGIQAFEAVATCPAGTFASLREHLLNHRRLVLTSARPPSTRSSLTSGSGRPRMLTMRLLPLLCLLLHLLLFLVPYLAALCRESVARSHPQHHRIRIPHHSGIPFYINSSVICVTSGFGDLVFFDLELPLTLNCKICRYCQVRMYLS